MPPTNPQRRPMQRPMGAAAAAAKPKTDPKLSPQQKKKMHALFVRLNEAVDNGYASEALKKLAELEARFPSNLNVHMIAGRANAQLARHAEAIAAFKKAVDLSSNEPEIIFHYAVALHKGGEYEEALLQFERVLYLNPD
ncbi:MAG TPA: hypothetical protein DF699_00760, partial [Phycisphaerales bacterium]|nr:hypothetical protein [Phycisphaerales bacterium]